MTFLLKNEFILFLDFTFVDVQLRNLFLLCSYATMIWDFMSSCFELKVQNSSFIIHMFHSATRVLLNAQLLNLWMTRVVATCNTIGFTRIQVVHVGFLTSYN